MKLKQAFFFIFIFTIFACQNSAQSSRVFEFEEPQEVKVKGYQGILMEPFLSRNGKILLFNNSNNPADNTNIHWATKIDDLTFQYQGEVDGINTQHLEGVPTLDKNNQLFFVSNRNYGETLSTIFQGNFNAGKVENISLVKGVSKEKLLWINFDVEVSEDGETLYLVDSQFSPQIVPQIGDIFIAKRAGEKFERVKNSGEIFKNINTKAIEYAVAISADELEIYFTRLIPPITPTSIPEIFYATRNDKESSFDIPRKVPNINGFVEAATISADNKLIYFHKKSGEKISLFCLRKK
ncbi:MAG: hypothetical protein AAB336_02830 [Acidobacteriota bacterium]